MNYTCVLFDLDGTLVDTESIFAKINQEYINLYGDKQEYTWETRKTVLGKSPKEVQQIIIDKHKINKTVDEFTLYKMKRFDELYATIKTFPKVLDVVKFFKEKGLKTAIATSSQRHLIDKKLNNCREILKYIDAIICSDDKNVKKCKPSPDIFIEAARVLGENDMKKAIVFEDAINGVMAGINSGAFTIAIPDAHIRDDPFFKTVPLLLNSMADFKPEMVGLAGEI